MLKNRFTERKMSRSKRVVKIVFSICKSLIVRNLHTTNIQLSDYQVVACGLFAKCYGLQLDLQREFALHLREELHKSNEIVRVDNHKKGGCFLAGSPVRC